MDPSFLKLPAEVIRLSMRTHQKYFAVKEEGSDKLAPHFIVVANQAAPDGGKAIAKGNSKVLSARLADAQFFQSEDAKKKLEDYYEKLGTVVFHKKLGSIKDKAERVAALAAVLAPKVGADADKAEQAARLAKCDLVTNMVIEFTSLQGQIGADMYRAEGGEADIATAIEQHYKPVGPSDSVPTEPVAIAVALADKLDTLVGFWAIDEKPTGSKDPFALRRAALGVVRIILENGVRLDLQGIMKVSHLFLWNTFENLNYEIRSKEVFGIISVFNGEARSGEFFDQIDTAWKLALNDKEGVKGRLEEVFDDHFVIRPNLLTFILDRLKVYLRDQGFRHDIIDAVISLGGDDLVDIVNRITALQSFIDTADGENLLAGYKRAANILKAESKKGDLPTGEIDTLSHPAARELQDALSKANIAIDGALAREAYGKAMTALSNLRGPIDAFFEAVRVVDEDTAIRRNNLLLLSRIRDTSHKIADFERIGG
jgi:glycyl-tRNA synthetase beta chain